MITPKRALSEGFVAVAKALAHRRRLEILDLPAQGERSVEALAGLAVRASPARWPHFSGRPRQRTVLAGRCRRKPSSRRSRA
jgi:hypothetical protein